MSYRNRSSELRYIKYRNETKPSNDCVFCSFNEDDNEYVVEKLKYFIVVINRFGYDIWDNLDVLDHLMIVPKTHTESVATLPTPALRELAKILAKYEGEGYSYYARAAGQVQKTIPHQHTHLIKLSDKPKKLIFFFKKPYFLLHR